MKRLALLILPAVLSACAPAAVEKKKRFPRPARLFKP